MRIQRGLSSRFLPCGCLAGIYETYEGEVVAVVDARSTTCADPAHAIGRAIAVPDVQTPVALRPPSHE